MVKIILMTKDEVQLEALAATDGKQRCSVVLGTGVGKTLVGLNHIDRNTTPLMKVLIVAPKRSIFQSWKDDAEKFDKEYLLGRMVFTTYLSLNKHNPNDYNAVYLDEAHSLLDSHRGFLQLYKGKVLGLTGTPPKRDYSEKGKLLNEFCPVVFTFKADDAVENKILNDYQIIVHKIELSTEKNYLVKMSGKQFMTDESSNYTYWSRRIDIGSGNMHMLRVMRMKAMMEYPSKEKYTQILMKNIPTKCIVFANTQAQADRLCDYSYHSGNKESEDNLELFKKGEITKLSTVLQLNEGVNIPDLKQGIIMHAYGNERKASQRIGRLLRLNPDDKSIVHILCYVGTIDEKWVKEALEGFDQNKVLWKDFGVKLN
jgi:superfamily II DNA or RNA helicase